MLFWISLAQDKHSHWVAAGKFYHHGPRNVGGEVTTKGYVDKVKSDPRRAQKIGYTDPAYGIDFDHAGILVSIHEQSPDIAQGVDKKKVEEQGAGTKG